jgi:hypothetical protein
MDSTISTEQNSLASSLYATMMAVDSLETEVAAIGNLESADSSLDVALSAEISAVRCSRFPTTPTIKVQHSHSRRRHAGTSGLVRR